MVRQPLAIDSEAPTRTRFLPAPAQMLAARWEIGIHQHDRADLFAGRPELSRDLVRHDATDAIANEPVWPVRLHATNLGDVIGRHLLDGRVGMLDAVGASRS